MSHAHILQDALTQIPPTIQRVQDYEHAARQFIRDDIWHYIQSGSDQALSVAANRLAFDELMLVPRVLRDVHAGSACVDLFGHQHASPVMLAPVAYHGLVHADAELATVQAAVAMQTAMVVSTLSSRRFLDIRQMAEKTAQELNRPVPPLWLQLYSQPSREQTLKVLQQAQEAGFEAVMWTIDAHYKRSELSLPAGVRAVNIEEAAQYKHTTHLLDEHLVFGTRFTEYAPSWEELAWLRQQTDLPLLVKGVLSPVDAQMLIEHGIDGLVVSNHGGRVLDGTAAPMHVLPTIRAAVGKDLPILLDGGVRWGTDVVKAVALGANAVMIGRPQLHALAVAGTLGVAHMLHLLKMEVELAMAQLGCATLSDLDNSIVWAKP